MITRRKLVTGLAAFIAAPAIIRVADLMPVRAWNDGTLLLASGNGTGATPISARLNLTRVWEYDENRMIWTRWNEIITDADLVLTRRIHTNPPGLPA